MRLNVCLQECAARDALADALQVPIAALDLELIGRVGSGPKEATSGVREGAGYQPIKPRIETRCDLREPAAKFHCFIFERRGGREARQGSPRRRARAAPTTWAAWPPRRVPSQEGWDWLR